MSAEWRNRLLHLVVWVIMILLGASGTYWAESVGKVDCHFEWEKH